MYETVDNLHRRTVAQWKEVTGERWDRLMEGSRDILLVRGRGAVLVERVSTRTMTEEEYRFQLNQP